MESCGILSASQPSNLPSDSVEVYASKPQMTSTSPNPQLQIQPGAHDFSKMFAAAAAAANGQSQAQAQAMHSPNFQLSDQSLNQQLLSGNSPALQWMRLQQQAILASRINQQNAAVEALPVQECESDNQQPDSDIQNEDLVVKEELMLNSPSALDEPLSKKARVESIVNSFHHVENGNDDVAVNNSECTDDEKLMDTNCTEETEMNNEICDDNLPKDLSNSVTPPAHSPEDRPRSNSKRKSSMPQQRAPQTPNNQETGIVDARHKVQEVLEFQKRLYLNFMAEKRLTEQQQVANHNSVEAERSPGSGTDSETGTKVPVDGIPKDMKSLKQTLKNEMTSALSSTIDRIFTEYLAEAARIAAAQNQMRQQHEAAGQNAALAAARQMWGPFYPPNMCSYPFANGAAPSIFPGFAPGSLPNSGAAATFLTAGAPFATSPNIRKDSIPSQMDGFSVLTGQARKKRSKVTDSRLTKKLVMRNSGEDSRSSTPTGGCAVGAYSFPPTMVGHPLYPSFGSLPGDDRELSPSNSDGVSDLGNCNMESNNNNNLGQGSTPLTQMHLRKAKLLFFFTRYPSSNMLKSYFPDVRFNKNTTAQLVKWFSNFREFYYIQMEKFARAALQEGITQPENIAVSTDSELYRQLNQHYNRNNHIQPPTNFRDVVEATLREFFLAIQLNKDVESSWKKQIYKVIARLDDSIPEYFKNPNFVEQLES